MSDKYLELAGHPTLRASGALARIWPAWLPEMVGKQHEQRGEQGLKTQWLENYSALVLDILAQGPVQGSAGTATPHQARLGQAAADARVDLHNHLQDRMADQGDLSDVRDIAAKAVTQICKLALVFHLAAHPDALREPASDIDDQSWAAAHCIGLWFLEEAVRVQRMAMEEPMLEAARRTLAWLGQRPEIVINRRALSLYGPRPRPNARQAGAVFDLLEDLGWVRAIPVLGKRQPQFLLHPLVRKGRVNGHGR